MKSSGRSRFRLKPVWMRSRSCSTKLPSKSAPYWNGWRKAGAKALRAEQLAAVGQMVRCRPGGADSKFGYAESNENLLPYGLLEHVHMPEIAKTIERLSGGQRGRAGVHATLGADDPSAYSPPFTAAAGATTGQCLDAARRFYAGRAFVRVCATHKPPQTKWATGSNLAFVSYAADPERNLVIAMGVVDNLGKGAAGQAVQNANLICGLPHCGAGRRTCSSRRDLLRVRVVRLHRASRWLA